jgi:hypothetical protein
MPDKGSPGCEPRKNERRWRLMELTHRIKAYVAAMPPAISGQGGHNQTFHVAYVLKWGFGLSDNEAWPLLKEYNARCEPTWTDTELRHKLAGVAYARHEKPFGHLRGGNICAMQSFCDTDRAEREIPAVAPRPEFDTQIFGKLIADRPAVDENWLAQRSPICPWNRTPTSFLHALYRKGENVVVFDDYHSQGQALWTHPGLPYDARALSAFTKANALVCGFSATPWTARPA